MADSPIKLHHLRPAPGEKTDKMRVGRGEASKGKTSGRGTKGTGARKNVSPRFEGGQMPLQMRLPKLKGFRNRNKVVAQVVNVSSPTAGRSARPSSSPRVPSAPATPSRFSARARSAR